jgi:hypothetical protein
MWSAMIVPIQHFGHYNLGQAAGLLLEDANSDGFIIDFILKNVRDLFNTPRVSFAVKHGGGSVIEKNFQAEIAAQRITYAYWIRIEKVQLPAFVRFLVKSWQRLTQRHGRL